VNPTELGGQAQRELVLGVDCIHHCRQVRRLLHQAQVAC
jgi:hypothetical protein